MLVIGAAVQKPPDARRAEEALHRFICDQFAYLVSTSMA